MKKSSAILSLLYLLSISAYAASTAISHSKAIKWLPDGQVINSAGQRQQLLMQNIYSGLVYLDKTYVMGFRLNSEGINTPTVAEISADFVNTKYWIFDNSLQSFFIYQDAIYSNDAEGNLFSLSEGAWHKSELRLPKNAVVVHASHNELLICYRASPTKEATTQGGCYSLNHKWDYPFFWYAIEPKLCDGNLHIFEDRPKGGIFRKLSIETGEILYSTPLKNKPKDLCEISRSLMHP